MVAGMCVAVLMTTGRTIGAEQAVLNSIDNAGSRAILVRAQPGAGLTTDVLDRLSTVNGLEWVGGFGAAQDYANAAFPEGPVVPVRKLYSLQVENIGIPAASIPNSGAFASERALITAQVDGSLAYFVNEAGEQLPVINAISVPDYLEFLEPAVFVPGDLEPASRIGLLVAVVSHPRYIEPVSVLVKQLLGNVDADQITVETSVEFANLRSIVGSQLGWSGRTLVFILLGITAFLAATVQYGSVLMKRRDYGRRRALGATRMLVASIVIGQALLQSIVGSIIGCAVSFAVITIIGDPQPPWTFYLGVGILAILTGLIAAIIPSAVASRRDPLKELRVP
ncbi:ABC transporter permease [Microbacterium sp. M]|uniref:ABC transporter permease n=1 Tax=Microbacterium sp. M TaxID=3377125 RepID=UPI003864D9C5